MKKAATTRPRSKTKAVPPPSPLEMLLPYQKDWVNDAARFKIGCWSRQTGKSFSTAAEAVTDCLQRKTTWVTLSAGERQALEWMLKAREWAQAYSLAVADYVEKRKETEALLKKAEILWPNGSRLIAIPANPATARGYSANLTLDEFAFHENPDAIWRAIYPSISNPLKEKYKVRIVSTPNGQGNRFHDLWTRPNDYSKHFIDIYTAASRGLPVDIEELRRGLDDPEGWAQEYECQFIDTAAILLPYELIAQCESPEASLAMPDDYWQGNTAFPVFGGIDFGRKRNLTVGWFAELVADLRITREVLCLNNMPTGEQAAILSRRIQRCQRVCVDYTGPGVGLGDLLVDQFGLWNPDQHRFGKIELCTLSQPLKVELYSKLRMAFESRSWRIPSSRDIREDLHSMHRVTTPGGSVTYKAPMTANSHADRCCALALCQRATRHENNTGVKRVSGIRLGISQLR